MRGLQIPPTGDCPRPRESARGTGAPTATIVRSSSGRGGADIFLGQVPDSANTATCRMLWSSFEADGALLDNPSLYNGSSVCSHIDDAPSSSSWDARDGHGRNG
eukprot:8418812-Pyramimonas_sp.AAC.1